MAGFVAEAPPALVVSLAEIKAEARIATSEENALLAGLLRGATELCERFTGTLLIARPVTEIVPSGTMWARRRCGPSTT